MKKEKKNQQNADPGKKGAGGGVFKASKGFCPWGIHHNSDGENDIFVENYKGILQYSDDLILLQGKNRKIELKGKKLTISYYTNEDMKIRGMIETISFL